MEAPEKSTRAGIQPQGIFLEFPHGSSGEIHKSWGREIFRQAKGWKIEEYFMYFQFFILHDWRKRSAIQPQGIFPEFPLNKKIGSPCQAIRQLQNRKTRGEKLRSSLQSIALHKTVTVRQIFSDGPGKVQQACSFPSAVSPFPRSGCLALPHGTDESRASI